MDDRELAEKAADVLGTALAALFERGIDMAVAAKPSAPSAGGFGNDPMVTLAGEAFVLAAARAIILSHIDL